ncbi:hypothetical protein AAE478_000551 [Parahypoxylon ruwenzoriense]
MATSEDCLKPSAFPIDSYDTALCIIPPRHLWTAVEALRSRYDKAYLKWPPHVNLVYPFVPVQGLSAAMESIISQFQARDVRNEPHVRLDAAGFFPKAKWNTIFIHDQDPVRASKLNDLRNAILGVLGHSPNDYQMHMTIAQSKGLDSPHRSTLEKAKLLPVLEWTVDKIYILIRCNTQVNVDPPSQMKVWGEINLASLILSMRQNPTDFYQDKRASYFADSSPDVTLEDESLGRPLYAFSPVENKWTPQQVGSAFQQVEPASVNLTVASYNVKAEFQHPPTRVRYSIVIRNLLNESALADVLILEEVTDDFLTYLCKDKGIREHYLFISNGPPDQADIEPLPDHLNIVVLSKWPFSWSLLSLPTSHKNLVTVQFGNIGKREGGVFFPVILSAVHLTSGLTDASVEKKKQELRSILKYLSGTYPRNPWILAGDFNITTSVYTIETALKRKEISTHAKTYLSAIDTMLTEAGLVDTWTLARVQYGDPSEMGQDQKYGGEALGGEQGATFDPVINDLAADAVSGEFNKRPQRYDRILVKGQDIFTVMGFNMFGQNLDVLPSKSDPDTSTDIPRNKLSYGSDHWGIRCSLNVSVDTSVRPSEISVTIPIDHNPASATLADISGLADCLSKHSIFPNELDPRKRKTALSLLEEVLLQGEGTQIRGLPPFIIVPVGSYGLGVWTATSDIDCLCIGPISSKTFFALAIQRLRRAAERGIKILRRVDANSGTMLELKIGDIRMDLQYCPAASIAETWPAAAMLPSTDDIFKLPTSVLTKLKPVRDLYYLRRTIPDFDVFKVAYRLIKCWAKRRGIYAAKFGYLGGIQISILLSRLCKLLSHEGKSVSVPTVLTTFFYHYAGFDWKKDIAFDPFFHKRLSYVRTAREPMVILGFHGPSLNTAQTASVPTVQVISGELRRANAILSQDEMTWSEFLGEDTGSAEFLTTYMTYIKVTAQFWGVSLAKGNGFVGWLESRCALLLVDLNKQAPQTKPRIWPARFVDRDASEEDTEYQGYYLIGLDTKNPENQDTIASGNVQAALYKFEDQIRGDAKYYDAKSSWMSATIVSRSELGSLRVDDWDWGKYTMEAEDEDIGDAEFWASMEAEELPGELQTKKPVVTHPPIRPAYKGRFRSAGDVLSRLRWDQSLDSSDYIVGYEDRFSGVMERPVDSWKSETTDEEFIPEHRIMYFKRKSDGMIVWDRHERRDEIFGSGVSSLKT